MAISETAERLLGRQREREVLERLLEAAHEGHGGVLVVHGQPGVGKTALLEYAVETAREFCVARIALLRVDARPRAPCGEGPRGGRGEAADGRARRGARARRGCEGRLPCSRDAWQAIPLPAKWLARHVPLPRHRLRRARRICCSTPWRSW
jgi:AAA ATPase domain